MDVNDSSNLRKKVDFGRLSQIWCVIARRKVNMLLYCVSPFTKCKYSNAGIKLLLSCYRQKDHKISAQCSKAGLVESCDFEAGIGDNTLTLTQSLPQ